MTDDDPDAIWRSDDVPVAPVSAGTRSFAAYRSASEEKIVFDTLSNEEEPPPRHVGAMRWIFGATVATVVGVAAIVSVVVSGSEESAAPGATEPSTAPTPTTVNESVESTDVPMTTDVVVPSAPEVIELPAAVAAIGVPTEVLALSPSGLLHTLSLPSGRVRTVDLDGVSDASFVDGYGAMVVAPDSAAVGIGSSGMVVVPRSEEAFDVALEIGADVGGTNVEGWIRGEDGSTQFVVAVYPSQAGNVELLVVGADGEAVALPEGFVPYGFGPPRLCVANWSSTMPEAPTGSQPMAPRNESRTASSWPTMADTDWFASATRANGVPRWS